MNIAAILLAAGASTRMGKSKLTISLNGISPLNRSFFALRRAGIANIIITTGEQTLEAATELLKYGSVKLIKGGVSRAESVFFALKSIENADIVVIHDAARCLVSPDMILESIESARKFGSGIAAIKAFDTIRNSVTNDCIDRDMALLIQTPQTFLYDRILMAYESLSGDLTHFTDDCSVYLKAGFAPNYVSGSLINQKLTTKSDIPFFMSILGEDRPIGFGTDTHRLIVGRALVLGGVTIPNEKGLLGHSDADVLTHAIIDALLGAAVLRDIGYVFPDSDPAYADANSILLLENVGKMLLSVGYIPCNVDATIVAQSPKLSPYIESMRLNIARSLNLDVSRVNVKATTTEGTNDEGHGLSMTSYAVCTLQKIPN
ncbi:MAG: 2-C-methyl-D-erythritol 2,4-cyclodiphosphate synthase [Clostridia bacterium]